MIRFVDPVQELGGLLLGVEKPARYAGGEFGRLARKEADLRTLIAFPDLYEIGMSNQALRILYNGLNRMPGVSCDRAFAPAPDFEKLLRETSTPLYGLDTGISLASLDLLMFTLGYELGAGGVLSMLDLSGIPLRCAEREDGHPVVIAGGPVVSNPLPYSLFIDAFWIGEAEAGFFDLVRGLLELKAAGGGRKEMLEKISAHPNVWTAGKKKAARAIDAGFAGRVGDAAVFPVPGMKIAQHHGAVEIMRGCPNGCRFCHAGFWYRPEREKKPEQVIAEAAAFINEGGYREISLSSLSSGDYTDLGNLVDELNRRFGGRHISFQLPSLKVSSFSLSLLEKISETRKSGLTFAVETPVNAWQMAINKEVTRDSVAAILKEAKKRGWRGAKFYFMIGLPAGTAPETDGPESEAPGTEEAEIVDFIADMTRRTNTRFNINVGIFVPKPHTPYQGAAQIDSETAAAKLDFIRTRLKSQGHKVSVSDPLTSLLEGVLSRGDERVGPLLEEAWRRGSRLDPWREYIKKDVWHDILEKNRDMVREFLSEKKENFPLPWSSIDSGVSAGYLRKEREKSENAELTPPCAEKCEKPCGVCGKNIAVTRNHGNGPAAVTRDSADLRGGAADKHQADPAVWRVLFSFSKKGSAVFHGHLSLIEIFSMSFNRARLPVIYTQGFNPLAKIEIAAPLSTGAGADAEIAAADFACPPVSTEEFAERLNRSLPEGIRVEKAEAYFIPGGRKKHSLSSLLWGFTYTNGQGALEYVKAGGEKQYRQKRLEAGDSIFSLRRNSVLAKNIIVKTAAESGNGAGAEIPSVCEWIPYFEVYSFLYPDYNS
jgi:radical SAM superfamily enzyme YgiQ (UPF0313 family)